MGADGHHLLHAIDETQVSECCRQLPSVEILRQVWVQQYYWETGVVQWRSTDN